MLRPSSTRRHVLRSGGAAAAAGLLLPGASQPAPAATANRILPDGGTGPFPIPWLDKNGSHNQPAGPGLEPVHIYHFKGRVARCAGFNGVGTTRGAGAGERILFGTRTTDYGIMDGEYWAARAPQHGAFSHI